MNTEERLSGRRKLAAVLVVLLTVAVSWWGGIDRKTEEYIDDATVQALAAFASARVLNAVITMAQSVEVGQSSGLGVKLESSFRPLELLDPVNDLVEQYSTVMQFAVGSLVTQKLLIEIVSTEFFKIALTAFGALVLASLVVAGGRYAAFPLKLFALAALLRFLFVLVLAANGLVDQAFVSPKTQENMQQVEVLSHDVQAELTTVPADEAAVEEEGWWDSMSAKVKALVDVERYKAMVERIRDIVPNILNLMALFVFKTLLMPLVFLYLLLRGFRAIWGVDFRDQVRAELAEIRSELRIQRPGK